MNNSINKMGIFYIFLFCFMNSILADDNSYNTLKNGFYDSTCPLAEQVITDFVLKALTDNSGVGAGLIRLQFHDCFVRGCDASVLLDSTPNNPSEKESFVNAKSLRGFEVIDEAKAQLESLCPETVSCADIIAYAARDAAKVLGDIKYKVRGGRRDGLVSKIDEPVMFLPSPFASLSALEEKFSVKGLTMEDLVVLSGAHSLGQTHCTKFKARLYDFTPTQPRDSTLDPSFADTLSIICPKNDTNNATIPLDFVSPNKLDSAYYNNILSDKVSLRSDQVLDEREISRKLVKLYAADGGEWKKKFGEAMVKMGEIEVLVGEEGEIRKNCRMINHK